MSEYKGIKGFQVQTRTEDPVPYAQALADNPYAGVWGSGGSLNTTRRLIAGTGPGTAALGFGGYSTTVVANNESYNGTSWTELADLNTARGQLGGANHGSQTAGLAFGGETTNPTTNATEEYDGSSWTSGGNLNTARQDLAGCGTQTAGLAVGGAIVPPKVVPFQTNRKRNKDNAHDVDADNLKDMIESLDNGNHKILVSAPSSKILGKMLGQTPILDYFKSNGYQVMHITSKFGAVINGKKVGREKFFDVLTKWGGENDKKFVIFHYSILSEGINVNGLTHTILLRNLPVIEMAQTIGRVIRVHKDDRKAVAEGLIPSGAFHLYKKAFGQVTMPIGYRMGDVTKMRLEQVVNSIFIEGVPPLAYCI